MNKKKVRVYVLLSFAVILTCIGLVRTKAPLWVTALFIIYAVLISIVALSKRENP